MKPRTILGHIGVPAIFSVGVFVYALSREAFSFSMVASVLGGGFLFYAAPHLLWAIIVVAAKPSSLVAHSGFIAPTLALALIASLWFFPPDASGLPMQWMIYWPLAIILFVLFTGVTTVYSRRKCA